MNPYVVPKMLVSMSFLSNYVKELKLETLDGLQESLMEVRSIEISLLELFAIQNIENPPPLPPFKHSISGNVLPVNWKKKPIST